MIPASKLSRFPWGCHEISHTWDSSCFMSWMDVGVPGVSEAAKIYLPLFIISRLLKAKKMDAEIAKKIVKETVQSSAFLGANCYFFLSSFCVVRCFLPFIPVREGIMLASFVSSYMAILIERENRRDVLTVYMLNVASETVFNVLHARGLVPTVPNGKKLLATLTLAAIMYLFKLGRCEGFLGQLAKWLLGTAEVYLPGEAGREGEPSAGARLLSYVTSLLPSGGARGRPGPDGRRPAAARGRHLCCPHRSSCARYVCRGFCESLLLGLALQAALTAGGGLLQLMSGGRPRPPAPAALARLGLCLGSVSGLFRLASCLLRRLRGRDAAWHAVPAGLLAAAGLRFYNSSSLTLYLFWKAVEAWYCHGAAAGLLPRAPGAVPLLYALSTGAVLSAAVLEPHQIRRSYWAFLRTLTGGRVAQMNWPLIARVCAADCRRLDDLRRFSPRFDAAEVRAASLPVLRELGQLR